MSRIPGVVASGRVRSEGGGTGYGWAPIDIGTGCILWVRPDEPGLADGAVPFWENQANPGQFLTGQGATKPVKVSTTLPHGTPTMRFNGNTAYFDLPDILTGLTQFTLSMSLRVDQDPAVSDAQSGIFHLGIAGDDSHLPFTNGHGFLTVGWNVRQSIGSPGLYWGGNWSRWFHLMVTVSAAEWRAYYQNVQLYQSLAGGTFAWPSTGHLGAGSGSRFMKGDMQDVVMLDHVATSGERADLAAFHVARMNGDWAIAEGLYESPKPSTLVAVSADLAEPALADLFDDAVLILPFNEGSGAPAALKGTSPSVVGAPTWVTTGGIRGYRMTASDYLSWVAVLLSGEATEFSIVTVFRGGHRATPFVQSSSDFNRYVGLWIGRHGPSNDLRRVVIDRWVTDLGGTNWGYAQGAWHPGNQHPIDGQWRNVLGIIDGTADGELWVNGVNEAGGTDGDDEYSSGGIPPSIGTMDTVTAGAWGAGNAEMDPIDVALLAVFPRKPTSTERAILVADPFALIRP